MKNFDRAKFRTNIQNHPKYIELLYDRDTDSIADGITTMIQESIEEMSPVIRIQLSEKNTNPLSATAKDLLEQRDKAQQIAKANPTIENLREYRHLRNQTNRIISKERYENRKQRFQQDGVSQNKKWKLIKEDTGQTQFKTPELIKEDMKVYTKPVEIAKAMNRLYISKVRDTISRIPPTNIDPLSHYKTALGPVETKLNLEQISMHQFLTTFNTMKSTSSSAADLISIRILKEAGPTLHPHLNHLV